MARSWWYLSKQLLNQRDASLRSHQCQRAGATGRSPEDASNFPRASLACSRSRPPAMRPTLPAQMRDKDVFSLRRALPRMSWSPQNLYNLARRQTGDLTRQSDFDQSPATLFQQRWLSKKLIRAYHGDFINEKAFKRWYLPRTLPDVRPREPLKVIGENEKFVGGARARDGMDKARKKAEDGGEEQGEGIAPVGSLMLAEIERRIDVLIFRANLARSVYDARRLVVHGYVMLNGRKVSSFTAHVAS